MMYDALQHVKTVASDGTFVEGPLVGIIAYERALERTRKINEISKFHDGQIVRVKNDVSDIKRCLIPTYKTHEAYCIAVALAGREVEVISPDLLTDASGKEGIYYTICHQDAGFYVLPERLIEKVR